MKYLFFDIECANCFEGTGKIYSFGYVLADENLNIIEKATYFVIIPDADFDRYVKNNMLSYPILYIVQQPKFPNFYNKIKRLFEKTDMAVGFETNSDVAFLLDEFKRYELEPFDMIYVDIRPIIRQITNDKPGNLALEYSTWCGKLANENHNSSYDALYTLEIAKEICKKEKSDFKTIINQCEKCIAHSTGFIYGFDSVETHDKANRHRNRDGFRELSEDRSEWILKGTKNDLMFIRFLDFVEKNDNTTNIFQDKKISISLNFEMYNFNLMIKLIQLIVNQGGIYVKKASLGDIFVRYDAIDENGNIRYCSKEKYVKEAINNSANIEILEFDYFLEMLGISFSTLQEMPNIDLSYLEDLKYARKMGMHF
ncbi:MAG: hypothetical protein WC123_07065 [Bacilli bacterium]